MPDKTARTETESISVSIFGRTYHLRGGDDEEYVTELASIVDERMREVSRATGTPDSMKVAILAALNLADDYVRASRGSDSPRGREAEKRMARMVSLLDEALAG